MPKIRLFRDRKHVQIEFPDSIPHPEGRRGGRGTSLHLQLGKVRDVTVEELDYILREHPAIYACLQVLPEGVVPGRTRRRLDAAHAAANPVEPKASKKKRGKKPS